MARSSRHKSHRSHKHRDRSDSEDEGSSRDKKQRVDEEESARVSRVSEQEKRKSSSKDGIGTGDGEMLGDHSKKRKDGREDSGIGGDRWNGGGDDDVRVDKESRKEGSDAADFEKSSKSKSLSMDLKGKSTSSRRREGSSERNDEKRRSEKESSRRENSGSQYKDVKEKERDRDRERERGSEKEREKERERGMEKDKKVHESRHERSDDGASRREERPAKQGVVISELQDEVHTPEAEKELDKRIRRRRDGSGDRDRLDDGRDGDDRHLSLRDGHSRNGSYKDGRYKEKHREEIDRDQRHYDDKHRDADKRRDERSSRTHTSERSDSKHYRDEIRPSENRDKKTKLQDGDRDGCRRGDDHSAKIKDNRGRKRSSDELEDQRDMKSRSAKEPRDDDAKNGSSSGKFDSRSDRARLEHSHNDKVEPGLTSSRAKNSPNSSAYAVKDQNRNNSRQAEYMREDSRRRDSLYEEARRSGAGFRDPVASGVRERMIESQSAEKAKLKDNVRSDEFMKDAGSVHRHDRIPRSDARNSPNQLTEKSHSSTNERRSERINARHSFETEEVGQRSSSSKSGRGDASFQKDSGRERDYLVEKLNEDDIPQGEHIKREHVAVGPSFSSRMGQLQGNSPARLPPQPVRYGVDSPSVLGSYEDESRIQNGDRKTNTRYKRGGDASVGRGPGTPWKNGPTWPSPVANGFIPPLQHGHPAGFHPGVVQFPAPPLFGIRPSMDLSNPAYHIHDAGNRFPVHGRPFGWHNPVDDCPPHLQVWDGTTNLFGDESHIYGRQEWDRNRHLISSRGWEMSPDMWSGSNGNANMEFHVPPKDHEYSRQGVADEAWVGQSVHNAREERARSEQPVTDSIGITLPCDTSPTEPTFGAPSKSVTEKMPEPSKMSSVNGTTEKQMDNNVRYCSTYLSKLDISVDLVQPELYKQFMSLIEDTDRNVTGNFSSQGQRKNNVDGFRLVAKSKQYAHNSLFPTVTDATFQRAMSLYRKQKEGMKQAMRSALPVGCSKQNTHSESTDGERANGVKPANEGEGLLASAASGEYMKGDVNPVEYNVEGEHQQTKCDPEEKHWGEPSVSHNATAQQVDISSDGKENGCHKISDAVMSVEGSEESEAIIPGCRVNVSRIHLSPESTH